MIKFVHINALYQVARYVSKVNDDPDIPNKYKINPMVQFRGTTKLHGTNSGIVCTNDSLTPQSRNRTLSLDGDNNGFAAFVNGEKQKEAIRIIEQQIRNDHSIDPSNNLVLYGEWIGPGIQTGMAINQLPSKQWVLFAIRTGNADDYQYIDAVPKLNKQYEEAQIHSIYDVDSWSLSVDFRTQKSREEAVKETEALAQAVEDQCPWGKYFGIEGMGEGIVWTPLGGHWGNDDLFFKTKGEKHKIVKRAKRNKPATDPEVVASVNEFLEFAVTENRLKQGIEYLNEMNHPIEMQSTSHFLRWVVQDIQRECALELQDSGLDWKQVSKAISKKALEYFKSQAMSI